MASATKATATQSAQRVNAAVKLLASGLPVAEASRQLAQKCRISERQARRYVERARDQGMVKVPGVKSVFTVKLPDALVVRIKVFAHQHHRTLSSLATQALEEFLGRAKQGFRGGD